MKLILLLQIIIVSVGFGQAYIRDIYINNGDVYPDSSSVFMSGVFNSLHYKTRDYIIRQELLFAEDGTLESNKLKETERNLRALDLFTKVRVYTDTIGYDLVDIYVDTEDKWSILPALLVGSGGGQSTFGGKIEEQNFLGRNYKVVLQGLNRTENDIGLEGIASLYKQRLFSQNIDLSFMLRSHKYKTDQNFILGKPFRNLDDTWSWQVSAKNTFGSEFLYNEEAENGISPSQLLNIHEQKISAYFSKAWIRDSRSFMTVYIDANSTERGLPQYQRAFDNTGKLLVQFSSVSQNFIRTNKLNWYQDEDFHHGGYGEVLLGRTFQIDSTGDEVWYAGARGEISWVGRNWYTYLEASGGSAFDEGFARYTYQDSEAKAFLLLNKKSLISGRFRQQTAWTWVANGGFRRDRQLILDNDYGLRGYDLNSFSGDSRILSNLEYRYFPGWKFWIFRISGAAFYDMGTTWDIDTGFENTRWYKSAGLGIRFHNDLQTGSGGVYRFDFAYNIDGNRFGGIIFTTGQSFSVFGLHNFRIPDIFGLNFDGE